MKTLKKYKVSLVFAAVWLACTATYFLASREATKYYVSKEAATQLKFHECSGGAYFYNNLGYRCDGYAPNLLVLYVIIIGILAFFAAVISLLLTLSHKRRKA